MLGMLSVSVFVSTLVAASVGAAVATPTNVVWSADRAHSAVMLSVSQLLVSKVRGSIPFVSAKVVTAPGGGVPLVVDATLDASAMTTNDQRRDETLRGEKFFDVERFPTITFASDRVVGTDPAKFTIGGALTIHGVTRPITFDAHVAQTQGRPGGKGRLRYGAVGHFRRSDYGISYMRGIVGNDVRLDVTLEAVN
jgi:polyisoprenoid-binding protein YceI